MRARAGARVELEPLEEIRIEKPRIMTAVPLDPSSLREPLACACRWLTEIAQVKSEEALPNETRQHAHATWRGAIRGEYSLARQEWSFFCPVWHTGQAIKALVLAGEALGTDEFLSAARLGAGFLLANSVREGPERGLIFAYEDDPDRINTSAILEALDGLFHLARTTGDLDCRGVALDALDWVARRMYAPDGGAFFDCWDPAKRGIVPNRFTTPWRPLLDDAVFLTGWELTGREEWKRIAVATAERLLREEDPPGNWIGYRPCNRTLGILHPRHAWWWGAPMLRIFKATGDGRFREAFRRAAAWYGKALRRDGGLLRGTFRDFSTDSFGHATSGAACAAMMLWDAWREFGDEEAATLADRALAFCMKVQFRTPTDPNAKGAILEKVLPPDGTDRSPYHLRDLGTIFFVQAAAKRLLEGKNR